MSGIAQPATNILAADGKIPLAGAARLRRVNPIPSMLASSLATVPKTYAELLRAVQQALLMSYVIGIRHSSRMKALLSLVLVLSVPSFAGAVPSIEETYAAQGRLILAPFASAPFPHPARAEGHPYQGTLYSAKEHYADNTVAIFIPKGFRETGRVDFIVHFHGWRNTVAGTLASYHLIEQLVASGKNAVLVVPEGPHDAPDSFGGKLEDPDGFKRFMDEVVATLRDRAAFNSKDFSVGRIILSGHSGGYQVIAGILDRGGLPKNADEVWLFDALYGQTDSFLAWADRTHGRLLNIYTDHGGTKEESEKLQARLTARGTKILATGETSLGTDALKTNQFVFIHTDLGHDDVMAKRNQFELFLKTSALADR